MKQFLSTIFMLMILLSISDKLYSQKEEIQEIDPLNAFDFWIGDWDVHWLNPDSSYTYGENHIVKTLDGNVIQEHFNDPTTGFKGTSISVLSFADSTWHQAWADNAGGYFDFHGIIDGDTRIFQTDPKMRNERMIIQRMVFTEITERDFIWNWELSVDNGLTWQLTWQIFYERKEVE